MIDTKHLIDVSGWKRFHLYDDGMFGIDMGTKMDKAKMKEIHPTVNFIGRANANNGITACVDRIDDIEPYPSGYMTLSLGGEYLGSCFIQPKPFYTSQNVIVLIPNDNMTDNVKRFIATMIFRESRSKYKAFVDELNRHIKTDFSVPLPVTSTGEPDWQYMENYMKVVMEESEKNIENLKQVDDTKHLIDVSRWHKCRLGDYFDFETGKDMLPTKEKDGDIPVVCLGSNNNGIGLYIAENPKHKLYNKGCITIAGWAGGLFAFYQEQKFYVKGRVKIAIPKQPLSKLAGLFMCTMIDSESWKYTYAEKASGDKLPNTELYLPVTSTGEPDWQYMEDYMRNIMNKSEQIISDLQIGA